MGLVIANKKTSVVKRLAAGIVPAGALVLGLFFSAAVSADVSTVVVTESNPQGWDQRDSRPGGTTSFVDDATAPLGTGALQLETDSTNEAKADFFHEANIPLSEATEMAYSTKQLTANSPATTASFQLAIDINGGTLEPGDFTTLVYEPYWQNGLSPDADPVMPNVWQDWNVDEGYFWSSQTVGSLTKGSGGAPFYTLADVLENHPDAQLLAYGVNVGTYNPSTMVNVDQVVFNGVTYDFEVTAPDTAAPDVALTNPMDSETVSGVVDVRGTVTDDNPDHYYLVIKDQNGDVVAGPGTVAEDESFTDESLFSWDTTTLEDGEYTVWLAARDTAGNRDDGSLATAMVTVNNTVDDKEECKNGGWATFSTQNFKNQGQCIASVQSSSNSRHNR